MEKEAEQKEEVASAPVEQDNFAAALAAMEGKGEEEPATEAPEEAAQVEGQEPPTEPAPAPEQPQISTTEYYARLAEMERSNRELKRLLKDKEAQPKTVPFAERYKQDPEAALRDEGITFDSLLNTLSGTPTEPDQGQAAQLPAEVAAELKELRSLKETVQKMQQEQQQTSQQQLVAQELRSINQLIDANPEKYEYISAMKDRGSPQLVFQTAAQMYKDHEPGDPPPSYAEVMDRVEEVCRQQVIDDLSRLRGLSFMASHLTGNGSAVQSTPATPNGAPKTHQAPKTLAPVEDTPKPEELTGEDLFKYALAGMTGQGDK